MDKILHGTRAAQGGSSSTENQASEGGNGVPPEDAQASALIGQLRAQRMVQVQKSREEPAHLRVMDRNRH